MTTRNFPISRSLRMATVYAGLFLTLVPQFSRPLEAQSAGTVTLTIHVTGARNTKGKVRAALFRSAEGFPNDGSRAIQTQAVEIDPRTSSAQIEFKELREGVYAVSVFHDENMNQKLDKNFVGVPKEGYGASNNPKKKMGPPSFKEAKFQLIGTGQSLEINLMY
jgi:uncharacterized protein (DUF2141 family)